MSDFWLTVSGGIAAGVAGLIVVAFAAGFSWWSRREQVNVRASVVYRRDGAVMEPYLDIAVYNRSSRPLSIHSVGPAMWNDESHDESWEIRTMTEGGSTSETIGPYAAETWQISLASLAKHHNQVSSQWPHIVADPDPGPTDFTHVWVETVAGRRYRSEFDSLTRGHLQRS